MPRRVTLTDRQKDALLRLPTSQTDLLKHYTLSDEDLGHIRLRRHSATKRRAISSFDTAISASRNNHSFSSLAPRPEKVRKP